MTILSIKDKGILLNFFGSIMRTPVTLDITKYKIQHVKCLLNKLGISNYIISDGGNKDKQPEQSYIVKEIKEIKEIKEKSISEEVLKKPYNNLNNQVINQKNKDVKISEELIKGVSKEVLKKPRLKEVFEDETFDNKVISLEELDEDIFSKSMDNLLLNSIE